MVLLLNILAILFGFIHPAQKTVHDNGFVSDNTQIHVTGGGDGAGDPGEIP